MFRSLALHNYRLWFIGALVSNTGAWMQSTAISWIVLTELSNNNAAEVGINMALQFGPQLVLVPITGYIADRFPKHRILITTQIILGSLALSLGILTISGMATLFLVHCFALVFGIVQSFDTPARQSFVSELVGREFLSNAVALNATSFQSARLIGPAIAGLAIAAFGAGPVFLMNACTFLAMIGALLLLRRDELALAPRGARNLGDIVQGVKYVWRRDDILVVMCMAFLMGTFGMNFPIFNSTMTSTEFGADASVFGLLSSATAIGSVAGALLSARFERPRYSVLIGAIGVFAALCGAAAWMPTLWAYGAILVVVGFASQMFMTSANATVQLSTAPEMRGRVMALYGAVIMGGTPLGAPAVGWVSDTFGPRWGVMVACVMCLIAFVIGGVWWLRARRAERMTRTGTLMATPATVELQVTK